MTTALQMRMLAKVAKRLRYAPLSWMKYAYPQMGDLEAMCRWLVRLVREDA